MSEEKKVRLRIVSRLTEPDGEVHEMKHARSGLLCVQQEEIRLEYDDEQDGEKAHIVLKMQAGRSESENRACMLRKGMISAELTFLPGQRVSSRYVTIYGDIPVAVDTRRVGIERSSMGGVLTMDYDVYMGGERTSRANMEITWRV